MSHFGQLIFLRLRHTCSCQHIWTPLSTLREPVTFFILAKTVQNSSCCTHAINWQRYCSRLHHCTSLQFANKTNAPYYKQYNWSSCYLL